MCGEETALIASVEGKRGMPRVRPPFPAVSGIYGEPTAVNNVKTLSSVPLIFKNGDEWFSGIGAEKAKAPRFSRSPEKSLTPDLLKCRWVLL